MSALTHYDTLQVSADATDDQVRAAYRRLVRTVHPDVGGNPEDFHQVQAAYEALKTENLRALYERAMREPEPEPLDDLDEVADWGESVPLSAQTTAPSYPSTSVPDHVASYVAPTRPHRSAVRVPRPVVGYVPFIGWKYWTAPFRAALLGAATVSVGAAAVAFFVAGHLWAVAVPLTLWLPAALRLKLDRVWPSNVALGAWVLAACLGGFSSFSALLLPLVVLTAVGASVGVHYPTAVKRRARRKAARELHSAAVIDRWTRVDAAARSNAGVLYWIERATPDGRSTDCRMRNVATGAVSSVRLEGQWEPKMWVVVARRSAVIEYCWEKSRKSAGAPRPTQDRAAA